MTAPSIKITVRQDGTVSALTLVNPVPVSDVLFEGDATECVYLDAVRITRDAANHTILTAITTTVGALEAFDMLVGEIVAARRKVAQMEAHANAQANDRPYECRVDLVDIEELALQLSIVAELAAEASRR